MFAVRGWRHIGGTLPERILNQAIKLSSYTDNWFDYAIHVQEADRLVSSSAAVRFTAGGEVIIPISTVALHQGGFFAQAFVNHGIDYQIDNICSDWGAGWPGGGNCECHGGWDCVF
jgi:hypothetical protein